MFPFLSTRAICVFVAIPTGNDDHNKGICGGTCCAVYVGIRSMSTNLHQCMFNVVFKMSMSQCTPDRLAVRGQSESPHLPIILTFKIKTDKYNLLLTLVVKGLGLHVSFGSAFNGARRQINSEQQFDRF